MLACLSFSSFMYMVYFIFLPFVSVYLFVCLLGRHYLSVCLSLHLPICVSVYVLFSSETHSHAHVQS